MIPNKEGKIAVPHVHSTVKSLPPAIADSSRAVPRSTTEAQWSIAATPESPSLREGFVALTWVVTLKSRMIALAFPPSAIIVDPMNASVPGDTSAQFAPSPDNKQKLSRAGNWAPDRLVTVESSPRSKHRKKRGRMQCVRQSDEVEVPAMIARFWDGTASYGHVPRALACTVQAGFAPMQ